MRPDAQLGESDRGTGHGQAHLAQAAPLFHRVEDAACGAALMTETELALWRSRSTASK